MWRNPCESTVSYVVCDVSCVRCQVPAYLACTSSHFSIFQRTNTHVESRATTEHVNVNDLVQSACSVRAECVQCACRVLTCFRMRQKVSAPGVRVITLWYTSSSTSWGVPSRSFTRSLSDVSKSNSPYASFEEGGSREGRRSTRVVHR